MKVLVTGAAGFIGFHLTKSLLDQGHMVVGVDNLSDYYSVELKRARLEQCGIFINSSLEGHSFRSERYADYFFFLIDITNKFKLDSIFVEFSFDVVVNLAAQPGVRYSLENPHSYVETNMMGFLNVLESCKCHDVNKVVYASSSSVYGTNKKQPFSVVDRTDAPLSMYAVTKKANELMAHAYSNLYGIQTIGLRFFTVYGPWGRPDMAPFLFAKSIYFGRPINVFNNGAMKRDFTYVDDIVSGIILLIDKDLANPCQVFNIGNGKAIDLMYFINCLEKSFGKAVEKVFQELQMGDIVETWADTSSLRSEIGFNGETEIEKGIMEFVEWFKSEKAYLF
ncbi:NAD-dependent epimerase/dehydratase family protein [Marinilongibacter aquaticus]|uniref:NAD-dependent epimerase/dehydratase family protein n=1 Tax=Marinilongibacter aquaticus TaxID=2975157 RepID=UPI0021BD6C6B|nr:NAD-dependent epimerase/dehydratase family protein [Marinilongibacter aquaticus]UBM57647.1 NAD-dependent epimerase/dehydratase family protein [Marinilongibacter aquaticus]